MYACMYIMNIHRTRGGKAAVRGVGRSKRRKGKIVHNAINSPCRVPALYKQRRFPSEMDQNMPYAYPTVCMCFYTAYLVLTRYWRKVDANFGVPDHLENKYAPAYAHKKQGCALQFHSQCLGMFNIGIMKLLQRSL